MKKFKYVVGGLDVNSSPEDQQKTLNQIGKDGFELVSVLQTRNTNGYIMFYFKKEIKDEGLTAAESGCPK